jgi:hypothetical protein
VFALFPFYGGTMTCHLSLLGEISYQRGVLVSFLFEGKYLRHGSSTVSTTGDSSNEHAMIIVYIEAIRML